jgi:hypothetical protein
MKKLIGYQIVDQNKNIPNDFNSFEVLSWDIANDWIINNDPTEIIWSAEPVYEGDVEEPTFVGYQN